MISARPGIFLLVNFLAAFTVSPEQAKPPADKILLDVVVTEKSGPPIPSLQEKDFTLLDNKVPRQVSSLRALDAKVAPIETIVVLDALNTSTDEVEFEHQEIGKFLRANGGSLAHPTLIAILNDTDIRRVQDDFSTDGNALGVSLDKYIAESPLLRRRFTTWGKSEALIHSLKALRQLAVFELSRPGRKIILWVSRGWPIVETQLAWKEQQQVFPDIVSLSDQLLDAHITLYSIDPRGSCCIDDSYGKYVKGISKPDQVYLGNLGLQVIAVQTGGLALNGSNDVAMLLQRCVADTGAYYQISFDAAATPKRDEYHHLEIKLQNSRLTARTRQGYYAHSNLPEN